MYHERSTKRLEQHPVKRKSVGRQFDALQEVTRQVEALQIEKTMALKWMEDQIRPLLHHVMPRPSV